jgi:hypothetical protein
MLLYFDGSSHTFSQTPHTPQFSSFVQLSFYAHGAKFEPQGTLLLVSFGGYKGGGWGKCEGGRVKRRGAKISDHVLRVPCGFGVRLGVVGGGEERGVGWGRWNIVGRQRGESRATGLLKRMIEFANIIPFCSISFVRNLLLQSLAW